MHPTLLTARKKKLSELSLTSKQRFVVKEKEKKKKEREGDCGEKERKIKPRRRHNCGPAEEKSFSP